MRLQQGDHGPAVAEIRSTLANLGLLHDRRDVGRVEPAPGTQFAQSDAVFDSDLDKAVRAFQQHRGLSVDGLVGPMTHRALREASYHLGARVLSFISVTPLIGDDVATLQDSLQELGFYTSRVDGVFGPVTHMSLMNYQREFGLVADGICGPATLRTLDNLGRRITGGSPSAVVEQESIRRSGPRLAGKRVVINPGLGGVETGQVLSLPDGSIMNEETILWDIASRLEGRMTAAGIETFMSRPRGTSPDSVERSNIANAFDADLLIGLSCDEYVNDKASGVATFYFGTASGKTSAVGELFSGYVQREICARTGLQSCRTHGRTWDILRLTRMPSVEVVLGYLTNPMDAKLLSNPEIRDLIADAILVAVKRLYLMENDDQATGSYTFAALLAEEHLTT